MSELDWRTVQDPDRFGHQVALAARDPENPDFRLGALARRAIEEWNLAAAELALGKLQGGGRDVCDLWTTLARRYLELGVREHALAVVGYAHPLALALEQAWQRGEALDAIAATLRRAGEVERARAIWKEAADHARADAATAPSSAAQVLADIAQELAMAGHGEWAREVSASVPVPAAAERARLRVEAIALSLRAATG